jgi:hypothetical protein
MPEKNLRPLTKEEKILFTLGLIFGFICGAIMMGYFWLIS